MLSKDGSIGLSSRDGVALLKRGKDQAGCRRETRLRTGSRPWLKGVEADPETPWRPSARRRWQRGSLLPHLSRPVVEYRPGRMVGKGASRETLSCWQTQWQGLASRGGHGDDLRQSTDLAPLQVGRMKREKDSIKGKIRKIIKKANRL